VKGRTVPGDTEKFYRTIAELDRLLVPGAGEAFWSARAIFSEMDRSFLAGWTTLRLRELLDNKEVLVFRDRNALTINITKGYAVSLALIEAPSPGLYLYPQHYMARNVGRAPLKVRRYAPDRPVQNDIYDPAVRLVLRDEIDLEPGESLERNGHTDVLDWESEGGTGYVLRLHSESLGNYEWSFDRETLAPKGVTVLDSFSSQMTTAMQMLATLAAPLDPAFIETGLNSEYFHVRWETLKTIGRIAPERTPETLERLKNDPHPSIRRAVEKTLQMNAANAGS
jgi:hypothetical protein